MDIKKLNESLGKLKDSLTEGVLSDDLYKIESMIEKMTKKFQNDKEKYDAKDFSVIEKNLAKFEKSFYDLFKFIRSKKLP